MASDDVLQLLGEINRIVCIYALSAHVHSTFHQEDVLSFFCKEQTSFHQKYDMIADKAALKRQDDSRNSK